MHEEADRKDAVLQAFLEEQRKMEESRRNKAEGKRKRKKGNRIAKIIREKVGASNALDRSVEESIWSVR